MARTSFLLSGVGTGFSYGEWPKRQHQPRRIEFLAGHVNDPRVSRHGQLAYSQKSTDINVWRTELSELGRKRGSSDRFIASTQIDGNPQFSPEGKHIVFASDRSGSREIWICNEDGSNTTQLTSMAAQSQEVPVGRLTDRESFSTRMRRGSLSFTSSPRRAAW